jgi:hypothetical protein
MIRITKRKEQLSAVILGAVILILLAGFGGYYIRLSWDMKQLEEKIAQTKERRALVKNDFRPEDLLSAEEELARLSQELSSLEDPVVLLKSLEKLTREANVAIGFFRPEEKIFGEVQPEVGINMPASLLEINLKGDWTEIILFYQLMHQLSPFLLTEELRLVAEGSTASGMIKLKIYH